jgi:hypothetical protein
MIKYIFTRFLFVFFVIFFFGCYPSIGYQLNQFFGIDIGTYYGVILLLCLFLAFVFFNINLIFYFLRLTDNNSIEVLLKRIRSYGFLQSFKFFSLNFFKILNKNFKVEGIREKYPMLLIYSLGICFLYSEFKSNRKFVFHNYIGVLKQYEDEEEIHYGEGVSQESINYTRFPDYIFNKSDKSEIEERIIILKNEEQENPKYSFGYFTVETRGYIFIQTGIMEGFSSYNRGYKGLFAYLECLSLYSLEKLIDTIISFLFPFMVFIVIYHYLSIG